MKRVFPRHALKLLCQRCALEGKTVEAGVQSKDKAFCFSCYEAYKEALAEKFNQALCGDVIIIDDLKKKSKVKKDR